MGSGSPTGRWRTGFGTQPRHKTVFCARALKFCAKPGTRDGPKHDILERSLATMERSPKEILDLTGIGPS